MEIYDNTLKYTIAPDDQGALAIHATRNTHDGSIPDGGDDRVLRADDAQPGVVLPDSEEQVVPAEVEEGAGHWAGRDSGHQRRHSP